MLLYKLPPLPLLLLLPPNSLLLLLRVDVVDNENDSHSFVLSDFKVVTGPPPKTLLGCAGGTKAETLINVNENKEKAVSTGSTATTHLL